MVTRYIRNVLVAVDQLANAVIGGDPDETISSRAGKSNGVIARTLCRVLSWFDGRHCEKSIEPDEGKDAVI